MGPESKLTGGDSRNMQLQPFWDLKSLYIHSLRIFAEGGCEDESLSQSLSRLSEGEEIRCNLLVGLSERSDPDPSLTHVKLFLLPTLHLIRQR